jgi:hypothetical protein
VLSESDVDLQVAGQPAVPFVGVLVGHGVAPLAPQGLDVDEDGRRSHLTALPFVRGV